MRQWICAFVIVFSYSAFAADSVDQKTIRVRSLSGLQEIRLSGVRTVAGIAFENKVHISRKGNAWIIRDSKFTTEQRLPVLKIEGAGLKATRQSFSDQTELHVASSGKFDVVESLKFEEYLFGVLSQEIPLSWPIETLKAQAVAARSYALSKLDGGGGFHVEGTILDQVYKHVPASNRNKPILLRARKAVEESRNIVLTNQRGEVVRSFYHADCGGKTLPAENIWPDQKGFGVATDNSCAERSTNQWKYSIPQTQFAKLANVSGRPSIAFKINPQTGRAASFELMTVDSQILKLANNELRRLIGFRQIKGSAFSISEKDDQVVFEGKGRGHGVGLCQFGARDMGEAGRNYNEILSHYYPQALIRNPVARGLSSENAKSKKSN